MVMDRNYWKEAYKDLWSQTSKKEESIRSIIEHETGYTVMSIGLGAGSADFLSGSATDHGKEKGDADLYVVDADAYVEVTGPNISVDMQASLWVRPDKVRNSFDKMTAGKGRLHVIVHVASVKPDGHQVIRVILLGPEFAKGLYTGAIKEITPVIRGRQERYYDVPVDHECIVSFSEFLAMLRSDHT